MTDTALFAPARPALATPAKLSGAGVRRTFYAVAGLTVAAAALRFPTLDWKGYWGDELSTVFLVRMPPGLMLAHIGRLESTPPLYYCAAWLWARLFGTSEIGLRSLSALAGTATVPIGYLTAKAFVSRTPALVAAALLAVNPFLVWYSQEARSYALLILLCSLSVLLAARAIREPTQRACWAWALVSSLALATHYFAAFLLIPEAVALVRRRSTRRPSLLPLATVAATGLALLPLALTQRSYGHAVWIAHTPLVERIAALPGQLLVGFDAPEPVAVGAVAAAFSAVGIWLAVRAGHRDDRGGALRAGRLTLMSLAIPVVLALLGLDYLDARNVAATAVPLAIVCAVGYCASPRLGAVAGGALCLVSVAVVAATAGQPKYHSEDWRSAAHDLGAARTARLIVATPGQPGRKPLEFYLPETSMAPSTGATVREIDVVELPLQGHGTPGRTARIRLSSLSIPGFTRIGWRRSRHFVIARYRAALPVRTVPRALVARVRRDAPVVLLESI